MNTSSVRATLFVRLGADLQEEPWTTQPMEGVWHDAAQHGGIDGGLALGEDAQPPACRPDVWDQLDGLLLAWLTGLGALAAGADEAVVEFPDTRIECELVRLPDDRVHVRYEDIDATLPLEGAQSALRAAASRLIHAASGHVQTDALRALQAFVPEVS